jgi:hypothetical protein
VDRVLIDNILVKAGYQNVRIGYHYLEPSKTPDLVWMFEECVSSHLPLGDKALGLLYYFGLIVPVGHDILIAPYNLYKVLQRRQTSKKLQPLGNLILDIHFTLPIDVEETVRNTLISSPSNSVLKSV